MDDIARRLERCFQISFPGLSLDQIATVEAEGLEAWDSLKFVTLIAMIEEEFGVQIDPMDWPELGSYSAFDRLLHAHPDHDQ